MQQTAVILPLFPFSFFSSSSSSYLLAHPPPSSSFLLLPYRLQDLKMSMDKSFINVRSDLQLERSSLERQLWGDEEEEEEEEEGGGGGGGIDGGGAHEYHRAQGIVASYIPTTPKEGLSFGLFMNLLGTFLYLLNYNIVIVSSADYADYLGAHRAVSGVVIGLLPFAAMISSRE